MKRNRLPHFLTTALLFVLLSAYIFSSCSSDNGNVQANAFKGHGSLAFVRQDLLYTLDGTTGAIKQITDTGRASHPAWSHDGQWLAYLNFTEQGGELWLARQDGSPPRLVQGLPGLLCDGVWWFHWSPTANLLAVVMPDGVWLAPVEGEPYRLVQCERTNSLAWSPDGNIIAYNDILPLLPTEDGQVHFSETLYTVELATGRSVEQLVEKQVFISVAAWWPDGQGLLYWTSSGASGATDGSPLCSFRLGDSEAEYLASGLSYKGWLSLSPQGDLVMVSGKGRILCANKSLTVANPASGARQNLDNPAGCVSFDPVFSPDGEQIAFVAAEDLGGDAWGFEDPGDFDAWINTHTLWLARADGSDSRLLTEAGTGVHRPHWSKDGKTILYVRDNALWLIETNGRQPEKITDLLYAEEDISGFGSYYYQVSIAWFQP